MLIDPKTLECWKRNAVPFTGEEPQGSGKLTKAEVLRRTKYNFPVCVSMTEGGFVGPLSGSDRAFSLDAPPYDFDPDPEAA